MPLDTNLKIKWELSFLGYSPGASPLHRSSDIVHSGSPVATIQLP